MKRGRSGRRLSICDGGVHVGHSFLADTAVVPAQVKPTRPTPMPYLQRRTAVLNQIQAALGGVDDDRAGGVVARIADRLATDRAAAERSAAQEFVTLAGLPASVAAVRIVHLRLRRDGAQADNRNRNRDGGDESGVHRRIPRCFKWFRVDFERPVGPP